MCRLLWCSVRVNSAIQDCTNDHVFPTRLPSKSSWETFRSCKIVCACHECVVSLTVPMQACALTLEALHAGPTRRSRVVCPAPGRPHLRAEGSLLTFLHRYADTSRVCGMPLRMPPVACRNSPKSGRLVPVRIRRS